MQYPRIMSYKGELHVHVYSIQIYSMSSCNILFLSVHSSTVSVCTEHK